MPLEWLLNCLLSLPGLHARANTYARTNRYETKKQRREGGVQKLLDQLPPDTIIINPEELATVDRTPQEVLMRERKRVRARGRAYVPIRTTLSSFVSNACQPWLTPHTTCFCQC